MRLDILSLLIKQTYSNLWKNPSTKWLVGLFNALLFFALIAAFLHQQQHQHTVEHYSEDVRDRWENNPDKHPHRMAHYGYVVFRQKYPLSFFDYGLDSYVGNVVFLEAHRQELPFNYSGFIMKEGERLSTAVFHRHQQTVPEVYSSVVDSRDGYHIKWDLPKEPTIKNSRIIIHNLLSTNIQKAKVSAGFGTLLCSKWETTRRWWLLKR